MITKQQLDSIRFYMGDLEIVNREGMMGGPKAYNTINALLSSGIFDEVNKIKEGRTIEIENSQHLKQYIFNIVDIVKAMQDFVQNHKHPLVTYRVDRYASIETLQQTKQLEGFYSTCTYGYLEQYAHIKKDVVLLEIHRDIDVPYLDFETLFENYAKKEEAELLLPFKAIVKKIEEVPLTDEEKQAYYDMDGKEPVGKYQIYVGKPNYESDEANIYEEFTSECILFVQHCLEKLMHQQVLSDSDLSKYLAFKEQFIKCICCLINT